MNVRNAPKVAVSEKETERSFVNSCASRSYRMISGLVADRLDDEREDRDGKDERREQQVELRDRPDGHAAPDDGEGPVLGLHVGLGLGLGLRVGLLGGQSLPRGASASTVAAGARYGSWYSRFVSERGDHRPPPRTSRDR